MKLEEIRLRAVLFFCRFTKGSARTRERRAARRERQEGQPEKEKERLFFRTSPASRLTSCA